MSPLNNMLGIDKILQKKQDQSQQSERQQSTDDIVLDLSSDQYVGEDQGSSGTTLLDIFNAVNEWLINQSSVKLREKLEFFELLATVLNAGISVNESLQILGDQASNPKFKNVIRDVQGLVEDGSNLADALRKNDDVFGEATCAIVEAGEKSGKLTEVLLELASQYERMYRLQKKVGSVMLYPIIVFVVMILLTIVVMVFVIPKHVGLFGGADQLPLPTKVLMAMSDFVLQKPFHLIGTVGAVFGTFKFWKKSAAGREQWGMLAVSVPLFGPIMRGMILSRVTRIFGFLISSGVPIIEGLRISAAIAENPLYQKKLILAADDLGKGIPIAENLADSEKLFPKMLVNMIAVGEQSASLETVMTKVADFYDQEIERKIGNLSKIMEPFILAVIACAVVFMLLAVYLPILQMNDQILG